MNTSSRGRWYDQSPGIYIGMNGLCELPPDYSHVLGQIIIILAKQFKDRQKSPNGLISLGTDRIMGLMKSRKKRRKEDSDVVLYKAFTDLYLLEDKHRNVLAQRISITVVVVGEYVGFCKRKDREENKQECMTLIRESLEKGLREATRYMMSIGVYDREVHWNIVEFASHTDEEPEPYELAEEKEATETVRTQQDTLVVTEFKTPSSSGLETEVHKAKLSDQPQGMRINRQEQL
ncbi:MAG: hypothetical protein K2X66_12325 [Cyanobacteria bacterium]|nr:hypothetical protein [Cyanobacteriota bacterium]